MALNRRKLIFLFEKFNKNQNYFEFQLSSNFRFDIEAKPLNVNNSTISKWLQYWKFFLHYLLFHLLYLIEPKGERYKRTIILVHSQEFEPIVVTSRSKERLNFKLIILYIKWSKFKHEWLQVKYNKGKTFLKNTNGFEKNNFIDNKYI